MYVLDFAFYAGAFIKAAIGLPFGGFDLTAFYLKSSILNVKGAGLVFNFNLLEVIGAYIVFVPFSDHSDWETAVP